MRWMPDSFVIAIILALSTALLVWGTTASTFLDIVRYWGDGFWSLLSFAMQMCLMIMSGYVLATSRPIRLFLEKIAALVRTPRSAVGLTAFVSMSLGAINWGLGLVTSAILVRTIAKSAAQRGVKVDYRLLVACGYLGMATTWHAGLSASAPLLMATPKNFLEKDFGLILTSQTIFHPFNIFLLIVTILVLTFMASRLHPPESETWVENLIGNEPTGGHEEIGRVLSPADRIENSWLFNFAVGGIGLIWLVDYFWRQGAALTLDVVNFVFITLAILFHRTPRSFLRACEEGGRYLWGVVIQFPLYAGIFGMVKFSGFQDVAASAISRIATVDTFPLLNYWYSGLLNYIVPSGGSKWAIEAPYVLQAAKQLGVSRGLTVLSYAWGDMMTDAIQPFWAIPLLGIAKVRFSEIMGYLLMFFIVYVIFVSLSFAIVPYLNLF